jgi:predicted enzyme related to lactoylglutathione lyase
MKIFIFRCRSRPEVQAATRYETGSNLPRDECSDGWLYSELVDLKAERRGARLGIDIVELRRRVQQQGYHVWGAAAPARAPVKAEVPVEPPSFAPVAAAPVVVPPAREPAPHQPAAPAAEISPAMLTVAAPDDRVAAPRHQVVWFDIPVRDLDRAVRFYSAVLGVLLRKEQAGRGAATAILPHADGSIGGCLVQTADARPSDGGPLLYLNADGRLDAAIAATTIAGGTVLQPKHSIGPEGNRAIVLDTEGNRIALFSR